MSEEPKQIQTADRVKDVLMQWNRNPDRLENIVSWTKAPQKAPEFAPFPPDIAAPLVEFLHSQGVISLYSHQSEAIQAILRCEDVVISTGTASGKSLCYQLPIWNQLFNDAHSTALCLFPTKALTYDQLNSFKDFEHFLFHRQTYPLVSVYDGDTPANQRADTRNHAQILLSNPDMLHLGILPHHTLWERFFANLKYVVIDEVHTYRGVFGSHIANLIRRLNRILQFYGSHPVYIMTSATIGNPHDLASELIGRSVTWIGEDGSPHGARNFLVYNPPIVNQELGIRQGLLDTTSQLAGDLMAHDIQTLSFCRTRQGVEILLRKCMERAPLRKSKMRAYRSGYLKNERREIETGLKNRTIDLAAATNALELGIDIGGVDAVLMAGYPGTIASTRQRTGRAGRGNRESISVLVASSAPLDQYLARHPQYFIEKSPEEAFINPDNPLILLQHLQCAAFEIPFKSGDTFGNLPGEVLEEYLDYLVGAGVLQFKSDRYYWMADAYPANAISLRSSNNRQILLQLDEEEGHKTIGEVDYLSSLWMVHPGAIYLQGGETYFVESLDLEKDQAKLKLFQSDFTTESIKNIEIEVLQVVKSQSLRMCGIHYGELMITSQVTGYKRIHWETHEILDTIPLDLPSTTLRTFGYWMVLKDTCVDQMREEKMWSSDPNDYGPRWDQIRNAIRARDGYRCQNCGRVENGKAFHVHHKVPFKAFQSSILANDPSNLITLCPECHSQAEAQVRVRSAISGVKYAMVNLAPLLVMCDSEDLDSNADGAAPYADHKPAIMIFDTIPAGIGLSDSLYHKHEELLQKSLELINACPCLEGCPSCVGPVAQEGIGGKIEARRLLELLTGLGG